MSTPRDETDDGSSYSRQALQAMIERKRHNDFVRRREFDILRKLRRNPSVAAPATAARPSLFHSSMPSHPEDRALTLRKINEIEAQMSVQWRRLKEAGLPRPAAGPQVLPPLASRISRLVGVEGDTQAASQTAALAPSNWEPPVSVLATLPAEAEAALAGPDRSLAQSFELPAFVHDPELEEAVIRFAEGDAPGAEAALLALLAPEGTRADHEETWLVLFDLYRVTSQQAVFEDRAIEFAGRFNRSAPQWRPLGEPPGAVEAAPSAPGSGFPASGFGAVAADWSSPPVFDRLAAAALRAFPVPVNRVCRLSWAELEVIEPDAVDALADVIVELSVQPLRLCLIGVERLERILEGRTVRGDRRADPAWWKLRMQALRLMRREDEFELVALDYCVTYELSPPSWEVARCEVRTQAAGIDGLALDAPQPQDSRVPGSEFGGVGRYSGFNRSVAAVASEFGPAAIARLSGQVTGDASDALARLESSLAGAESLVISCVGLERIDFTAAGSLMNWVAARQAEGRLVHLTEVHRLVAGLFGLTGVSTVARIGLRRD